MHHHGESLRQITKDDELVDSIARDPLSAALPPRSRALVSYAVKLTLRPAEVSLQDIEALREVGLSDRGIHDAANVIAYYNFVNRIALGLGVELET